MHDRRLAIVLVALAILGAILLVVALAHVAAGP